MLQLLFVKLKNVILVELVIVGMCIMVYSSAQYLSRSTVNETLVEIVDTIVKDLKASPTALTQTDLSSTAIDPSQTLSPFYMVFDANKALLASTANFGGLELVPPESVFENARNSEDTRVTWQPVDNLRVAIVVAYYKGDVNEGFVLTGKSLKEQEKQQKQLAVIAIAGAVIMSVASVGILLANRIIVNRTAGIPVSAAAAKSIKKPLSRKTTSKRKSSSSKTKSS